MYFKVKQDQPNIEIVKYLPSHAVSSLTTFTCTCIVSYINGTLCTDVVINIDKYNTCTVCIFSTSTIYYNASQSGD